MISKVGDVSMIDLGLEGKSGRLWLFPGMTGAVRSGAIDPGNEV